MLLDDLKLACCQRRRLQQYGVWHANFADVMQASASVKRRKLLIAQTNFLANQGGIPGESLAMAVGVGVAGFDRQRQAKDDRVGRLKVGVVVLQTVLRLLTAGRFFGGSLSGEGPT